MEICEVNKKNSLLDFIKFPYQVYKNDANWVPPQIKNVQFILGEKNPFWEHAEKVLFLLKDKNKVVGRIGGIINYNHNNFHRENCGFFGFFECLMDYTYAKRLLDEVGNWLKEKDVEIMRGPMNPSMNDECGLLVEGFDSAPFLMMAYNPKYYVDYIEKYGLKKAKDLFAYLCEVSLTQVERLERIAKRVKEKGITIRPINLKGFHYDLVKVKEIYNTTWSKNWGFVPMTDKEIDSMAEQLRHLLIPNLCLIVEMESTPAGFILSLPNYNEVLRYMNKSLWGLMKFLWHLQKIKSLRVMAMGIKPEYQKKGIDALLYSEFLKSAHKRGYYQCECSWILEDNILMQRVAEMVGGQLYKKYRIYEMKI